MSLSIDLRAITMFSQLSPAALADVQAALQPRQLTAGELLFKMGDPGDELIIVVAGQVAIFAPAEDDPRKGQPIRIFQPGELLGEMALIDRKPRSLSARAEAPAEILALAGADFQRLLQENPEMSLGVMAGLSERIRYTTEFVSEVRKWVRRIAEGSYQTQDILARSQVGDSSLANLAAEFAQMAGRVKEREETLKQEVAQLRIEIDEARRKQESSRIMGSDYYQSLKDKVKQLRQQRQQNEE
jgi:CRP-like cAMP-binding protein